MSLMRDEGDDSKKTKDKMLKIQLLAELCWRFLRLRHFTPYHVIARAVSRDTVYDVSMK